MVRRYGVSAERKPNFYRWKNWAPTKADGSLFVPTAPLLRIADANFSDGMMTQTRKVVFGISNLGISNLWEKKPLRKKRRRIGSRGEVVVVSVTDPPAALNHV